MTSQTRSIPQPLRNIACSGLGVGDADETFYHAKRIFMLG